MSRAHSSRPACLLAVLLLCGCGFQAPPPEQTPPRATPTPPLSTMTVALSVPIADIERLVNSRTSSRIADIQDQPVKCVIGHCRLTLHAVRTGAISVRFTDRGLGLSVPFSADASLQAPGGFSFLKAKAFARGVVTATTTAELESDWQVQPHTEGSVELDNARLRIGPLVTSLTDLWNANEELLSRPFFKMLDKKIATSLRLQPKITQLWSSAFIPIRIGKMPVAWLLLQPQAIRVGKPSFADNALTLALGIDVRAQVIVGDEPPERQPTELPPPERLERPSDRFEVAVSLLLPYAQAARLAMDSLVRKPPRVDGALIRFTKFQIVPTGQDVFLAATFCADQGWDLFHWFSACGSGFLRGDPIFEPRTRTIRITNVRFDVQTENLVFRSMRFIAGPTLGQDLEHRLVFDVSTDVSKLERQIAAALAKPQGRDITIFANVESFGPISLTWTKDGFLASLSAQGSVHASSHL